jgi:3-carboxy-cis,cis-muconate cycloisomerase
MTDALMPSQMLTPLYSSAPMRAIMADRARLQRMLDFEAALARAQAAVGVIPAASVSPIGEACHVERFDLDALAQAAVPAGNLAIPMVEALTAEVAKRSVAAAGHVHWGATSQDVIDTALVLDLRAAIDALHDDLDRAVKGFLALAGRHRRTLAVARTMLQHALPMPFGLKLAGYAAALARSRDRLVRLRKDALVLQFGGAAGTLAALGDRGMAVAERLGALLDLPLPDAPWHSHRDRLAEVAAAFAILAGTCGKIARDTTLMMQVEVGEAYEPAKIGGGGSSTLPHKRNPIGATAALAAATIAPNLAATILAAQVQEHERAVGSWQSEWVSFPALALVTSGALAAVADIAEGLEIDVERVRDNLELSGGQIMAEAVSFALAGKLGRQEAHKLVQELSRQAVKTKRQLKDVIFTDVRVKAHLSTGEIGQLFLPSTYQGSAQLLIDRMVASSHSRNVRRSDARAEVRPPQPQAAAGADSKTAALPERPGPILGQSLRASAHLPKAVQIEEFKSEAARTELYKSDRPKAQPPAAAPAAEAEPSKTELPKTEFMRAEPLLRTDLYPSELPQTEPPKSEPAAATEPLKTAQPVSQAEPRPSPDSPPAPAPADGPGALMDVLSRAQAEIAAQNDGKPKP